MPTWKYNVSSSKSKMFIIDGEEMVLSGGDTVETETFADHAAQGLTKTSDEPVTRKANAQYTVTNESGAGGKVTQAIGGGIEKARVQVVSGGPVNIYLQNDTGNDGIPELSWLADGSIWDVDVNDRADTLVFEFEGGNGSAKMITYTK